MTTCRARPRTDRNGGGGASTEAEREVPNLREGTAPAHGGGLASDQAGDSAHSRTQEGGAPQQDSGAGRMGRFSSIPLPPPPPSR